MERLVKPLDATGGCFSTGYIVKRPDGSRGYLKALDYSDAFMPTTGVPVSIALQRLTETINFEKYVLARCRERGLDKIVISISDGTLVLGTPGLDTVEYLIFELADCDVRKQMVLIDKLDVLWRLKSLHDIAVGLEQLHRNDIVHQDLKPSNVLVFGQSSKLADFGRSACDGQNPPHASLSFAGDWRYAPPDVLYRFCLADEKLRKLSFDAYLLGSMVVFFFAGQGATPSILSEMPPLYSNWQMYAGNSDDAKLHLRDAFGRFLSKFESGIVPSLRSEMSRIVKELCEPDPSRRGHPKERRGTPNQFSLNRYVTRFDLLVKRAELGLGAGVI